MADEIAIRVKGINKTFKLPHEVNNSLKSLIVNFWRINRSFERQHVLKDINFDVKKGDFFGVVGRNGSGKSTLMKLLAGIYTPDSGTVDVRGKLIPFIELGVGFNHELTGRENVFLNGALLGFSRKQMNEMYNSIVEFAELERFMDQKLKNYSSGMQVRLAFSIAIRARGDILLLDEVLAVGDAAFQQKCYDYFEDIKRQKQTVVFISHDMGAIRRFCNKAVYIQNGEITHRGTPAEIADVYLEENMEAPQTGGAPEDEAAAKSPFKIYTRIVEQTANKVIIKVVYGSKDETPLLAGLAIMFNGVSVAEIGTDPEKPFTGSGELTYTLDTSMFNGGAYTIDAALLGHTNHDLLAFSKVKSKFIIKGQDPTKGSALKLSDTWQYR